MEYPYEASDEASESELLDKSLSMWKGWSALDSKCAFEPIPLDLHTAASIGQYDCVHAYIASDFDINKKNRGSWTALMYACYIGHDTIVNLLLDAKAKVDVRSDKGSTALMMAASCGNESVAYFLIQEGAELEIVDHRGWTALFYATYNGHQSMVQFLLENGAQSNAREPSLGITPLMMAAAEGHEIIVNILLGTAGVEIDLKNQRGDTARSLALMNGHMKIVSLIDNRCMSPSSVRSAPGLGDDIDLSSSDENFQIQPPRPSHLHHHHHHHHHLKGRSSKVKGPSILDGPEAFAKMLGEKKAKPPDLRGTDNADQKQGDTGESEDSAFCVSGALTIRSSNSSCSSSSAGGLAGALGVSCDASLSSNEGSSLDRSDLVQERVFQRPHQGVDPNDLVAGISRIGLSQAQQGRTEDYVNHLQQHQSQQQQLHVGWNLGANLQIYPSDPDPHRLAPAPLHQPPAIGYTSTVHPLQAGDPNSKGHDIQVNPEKVGFPFSGLKELLESLSLIKYLHIFEEQEIDLRVFLTLTDSDLREVGIKLMGPRRKLTNAIARWHSQAVPFSTSLEQVYADRVETAMQEMAIQLSEDSMKKEQLEAQVLQERELRSVVEGCLMEDKKIYQQMVSMVTDTSKLCHRMRQLYDNMRCYQVELVRRVQSMPLLSRRESDSGMSSDGRGGSPSSSSDIVRSIMSSPVLRGTAVGSSHSNEPMGCPVREGNRHSSVEQALSLDNDNVELRKLPMVDLVEMLGQLSHKLGRIVAMVTNNMDKIVDGQSAFSPNSSGNSLP
ncbi:ankyrin repeat and SAM domain-containing protein 3 isoform X3 [Strongylocentrotus purpuratus]|uniref:SAM domain-containing protein n=1 Tax=Strongylocentrotus purpuratus TaxID=7668 RepID=A0A7M7HHY6_STRPU|nr:ankyrin repeat and SAM domain-containing protein 3 isoform X3 [Strongylocentrotus purpuratus]